MRTLTPATSAVEFISMYRMSVSKETHKPQTSVRESAEEARRFQSPISPALSVLGAPDRKIQCAAQAATTDCLLLSQSFFRLLCFTANFALHRLRQPSLKSSAVLSFSKEKISIDLEHL